MKKYTTRGSSIKVSVIFCGIVIAGTALVINACNKAGRQNTSGNQAGAAVAIANQRPAAVVQRTTLSQVVTVADIRKSADGTYTRVCFRENEEVFSITDAAIIAQLRDAYNSQKTIKISYNPWTATVLGVSSATDAETSALNTRQINSGGVYQHVDLSKNDPDALNNLPALAELNTTTAGLTNVVPDMATAQAMFDYITHQCCALPGAYLIDHCISFQYCEDGCYARAHKMCWIINNTYHYSTHKIFSFAYGSSATLSVKAEKWGGCCINWWYHVAPLVNIKTPSGVKAYVFDPAMFDQPVLLATWLHAQANPACSGSPGVTSINIQPTSSYSPIDTAHFDTDPTYSSTNSTLISYAPLVSCP